MTRIERRRRIIFDAKLYRACGRLAGDFGNYAEPKIDAGGDTARGDYIAVTHDPCLLVFRAEERQQFGIGPMRGGAPALRQPGDAEHEGAGAQLFRWANRPTVSLLGRRPWQSPSGRQSAA